MAHYSFCVILPTRTTTATLGYTFLKLWRWLQHLWTSENLSNSANVCRNQKFCRKTERAVLSAPRPVSRAWSHPELRAFICHNSVFNLLTASSSTACVHFSALLNGAQITSSYFWLVRHPKWSTLLCFVLKQFRYTCVSIDSLQKHVSSKITIYVSAYVNLWAELVEFFGLVHQQEQRAGRFWGHWEGLGDWEHLMRFIHIQFGHFTEIVLFLQMYELVDPCCM